jgi:hypothetical protein
MDAIKIALALTVLAASPAFALSNGHALSHPTRLGAFVSDAVIIGGRYIGQDPDPNIRTELRRDYGYYLGND